jgi:2-haloacid dehalogenase
MPEALGFDIYGTLVDPLEMNEHLGPLVGDDLADRFSELWRNKQIEYTFRHGLMRQYEDFGSCTRRSLVYTARVLGVDLSEKVRENLLDEYQNLRPFPDVIPGIEALEAEGHALVAFSNGVEATARMLLDRVGILPHLRDVISVDDVKTFKPDPEAYHYLVHRLGEKLDKTWLVSSNPFDVIGAKAAGLKAAWIKRKPDAVFDPWGIEPDLTAPDLEALAEKL